VQYRESGIDGCTVVEVSAKEMDLLMELQNQPRSESQSHVVVMYLESSIVGVAESMIPEPLNLLLHIWKRTVTQVGGFLQ
jgi:hypothetical protein